MAELIREPIGLRVLLRALRPEDREPFLVWRADPQPEADALIEAGEADDRALLWASLLRWSEAERVADHLQQAGWTVTLQGIRAIVLDRAADLVQPPALDQGWVIDADTVRVRAVPEQPQQDDASLAQMLAFLDNR